MRLVIPRNLGQMILEKRRSEGLTQTELAVLWHVRPATVGAWESGKTPQPRFFKMVAAYLGITDKQVETLARGEIVDPHGAAAETLTRDDAVLEIRLNVSRRLAAKPPPDADEKRLLQQLLDGLS
jgi:transcriptional regulator with XRE-family HTH domain